MMPVQYFVLLPIIAPGGRRAGAGVRIRAAGAQKKSGPEAALVEAATGAAQSISCAFIA